MSGTFPHIIEDSGSLAKYLGENKRAIDDTLAETGAVLFRGFDVPDAFRLDEAVQAYGEDNFPYLESLSNAVRVNVTERVFTANEAPPTTSIYLHHEMAQTPIYPSKLFFYCEIPAETGGETPICRSDLLLERLESVNQPFVEALAEKGVTYTNVMPGSDDAGSGQGRSWPNTLRAATREQAEARLQALGYRWEWKDDGALSVTSPVLPAVRDLPDGRRSFFNQLIAAYRGWSDSRNSAARSIRFGDGSPISPDDMADAVSLGDELSHDLAWRAGDVALVDNFLVMHGRRPFEGRRRVLASLVK